MEIILAIDQGTTGSQAAFFSASDLSLLSNAKVEYPQHYPFEGHVEHDLEELWQSVLVAMAQSALKTRLTREELSSALVAVGITNQRETVCAWNRKTGEAAGRALVWQDRRTADFCDELKSKPGLEDKILRGTGLIIDPYFSASKMRWVLKNYPLAQRWASSGELALGTVDSYLIYRLSGGQSFVTDHTNASRTMLYDLASGRFDPELCALFGVPEKCLPEIRPSSGMLGHTKGSTILPDGLPISGCLGDQQSSLFGHGAVSPGHGKITFGTGSFLLAPLGARPVVPPRGLLCSVAFSDASTRRFALEGSVFIAAAALQFLRDQFGWLKDSAESEELALRFERNPELLVIPAFAGFGAPFWNPRAKGAILGLSLGTKREQIIRATLEAIALQNVALVRLMQGASDAALQRWGVDGGASKNDFLMQFQADVLQAELTRPAHSEMTALGVAKAALLGLGRASPAEPTTQKRFTPLMTGAAAKEIVTNWERAAQAISDLY